MDTVFTCYNVASVAAGNATPKNNTHYGTIFIIVMFLFFLFDGAAIRGHSQTIRGYRLECPACCWLLRAGIAVHGPRANSVGVSPSPRAVQGVSGRGLWVGGLRTSGSVNVNIVIHYSGTQPVGVQLYYIYFRFTNLNGVKLDM